MRDENYINPNKEPFILLKEGSLLDKAAVRMCNYKPISGQFMQQVYISLNACRNRIGSERKYNQLLQLARDLANPSTPLSFSWDLEIYGCFDDIHSYMDNEEVEDRAYRSIGFSEDYDEDNNGTSIGEAQDFNELSLTAEELNEGASYDEADSLASGFEDKEDEVMDNELQENEDSNVEDDILEEEKFEDKIVVNNEFNTKDTAVVATNYGKKKVLEGRKKKIETIRFLDKGTYVVILSGTIQLIII